jgi:hypothetical protein
LNCLRFLLLLLRLLLLLLLLSGSRVKTYGAVVMFSSHSWRSVGGASAALPVTVVLQVHAVWLYHLCMSGGTAAAAAARPRTTATSFRHLHGHSYDMRHCVLLPLPCHFHRQIYKLLSKEADVSLLCQPPGSSSSSDKTSGSIQLITQLTSSTPGSSNTSSSSSSNEAVRAAAVALGYSPDAYTVHLKPAPLEFPPVQFGTIDIDKAVAGASAGVDTAVEASTDAATTMSFSSSNSTSSTSSSSSSSEAGLPDVGYLKLLSFSATAPQEVAQALVDMQYEAAAEHGGHGLAGIIVDLRDNPGACDVASVYLMLQIGCRSTGFLRGRGVPGSRAIGWQNLI